MASYKINTDYALPEGMAIGMEGRFWDSDRNDPNDYEDSTLQGYYPDEDYKFATNKGRPARNFTPLKPWQPKPGDRRTGEIVWCWDRSNNAGKQGAVLGRYSSFCDGIYYIFDEDGCELEIDCVAKVYDIDKEFGMTIKELIDSRKPGDVLGI